MVSENEHCVSVFLFRCIFLSVEKGSTDWRCWCSTIKNTFQSQNCIFHDLMCCTVMSHCLWESSSIHWYTSAALGLSEQLQTCSSAVRKNYQRDSSVGLDFGRSVRRYCIFSEENKRTLLDHFKPLLHPSSEFYISSRHLVQLDRCIQINLQMDSQYVIYWLSISWNEFYWVFPLLTLSLFKRCCFHLLSSLCPSEISSVEKSV